LLQNISLFRDKKAGAMGRASLIIFLSLSWLCWAALPGAAEEKIRIAVFDFDAQALSGSWGYGWPWSRLEAAAADGLAAELHKSGEFSVLERGKLSHVLQEQRFSSPGVADPDTVIEMGKILGVQFIVTGSVAEFGVSEWDGTAPQAGKWKWGTGAGATMLLGAATLTARFIDTTTAEVLDTYEGTGSRKFAAAEFAGADFGNRFDSGLASRILAKAVENLARAIVEDAGRITPPTGAPEPRQSPMHAPEQVEDRPVVEGKIAFVSKSRVFVNEGPGSSITSGGKIYITLGAGSGVKVGDRFEVHRIGNEIRDPDTGALLDVEIIKVGVLFVTEVKDKVSITSIKRGTDFQEGDIVRLAKSSSTSPATREP
jgi:curli biogenesis system outer membrane secretion channel CsgG